MQKKIKLIILAFAILLISIVIVYITLAYLNTLSGEKVNVASKGVLTAVIYENGVPAPDGTNTLTPVGNSAAKAIQVKNISDPHEIDAYIRVALIPVFRKNSSSLAGNMSLAPTGNTVSVTAPSGGTVTLNLTAGWENNWIYDDGYYYCKQIIHPNELTPVLLESVTVSGNSIWATFQLEVLSDSIQAESGAASDVWGASIANQLEQP